MSEGGAGKSGDRIAGIFNISPHTHISHKRVQINSTEMANIK